MTFIIGSGCVIYFDYANICMVSDMDLVRAALMLCCVCLSITRRQKQDLFQVFKTLIRS